MKLSFPTLVLKMWHEYHTHVTFSRDSSHSICSTKSPSPYISTVQQEKRRWLLCTLDDRSHIYPPPLSCQQQYVELISPANDRDAEAYRSQMAIWLWSYCNCDLHLNRSLTVSDEFWLKKDQGQNTFKLNLKVPPLAACHALQFTVSLFKVKTKIGARSIYIWTKRREEDYECSKCNFYYSSIILLLITDSLSLCSSSETRSCSIHAHKTFHLWKIHAPKRSHLH